MKQPFDLHEQLGKALDWLISSMAEVRKQSPDWHVGHYFSATDLECRVRAAASELADGKEYGSGVRISGLNGFTLLHHYRRFLSQKVREGVLRADQPSGKHTCTGLRFRPFSWGLTEAEKRTQAVPREERRRWIRHYDPDIQQQASSMYKKNPLCLRHKPPRRAFYRAIKPKSVTDKPEQVTCKTCRKMLAKLTHPLAPELRADTDPGIVADWLEEHDQPEKANQLRKDTYER